MKRMSKFLILMLAVMMPQMIFALTPDETLQKARQKIAGAKSLSADFKMTLNGATYSGKIQSKGSKFSIVSNVSSSWYDGTNMWTYNAASKETTLFKPTASELSEANPLLYISGAGNYNVTASKTKKKGLETVVLVPKKAGTGVKNVMIHLNSSTFLPSQIEITPSSGQKITVTVSNIKLNPTISDSQFTYPKSSYKNVKVVDLR